MDNVVVLDDCSPLQIKTQESPGGANNNRDSRSSRRRSRSRSPVANHREHLYESEGTNTTSNQPDLQRGRLFVGNVDHRINRADLKKTFSRYGDILGVSIHKGFAFVQLTSEKNAKDAIIGEDGRVLNGSLLHVEFSQAAKKAGAEYEDVEKQVSKRRTSPKPTQARSRSRHDYDDLRDREAKLARVLAMEKELAYYQSQDRYSRRPSSDHYDRRSRRDFSPPPRDYERSYRGRDREPFYGRSSPPMPVPSKSSMGSYRDSLSSKSRPGYEAREYGYGSRSEHSVGYGGSSGGREKSPAGSSLGWPGSNYSKSQRPFSGNNPWN